MERYGVGGRSVATAATLNHAGAALWNPSTNIQLSVYEIHWFKTVATADSLGLGRITTRGTPGSTVTPDADNNFGRSKNTPGSGALLDLAAYTLQPTLATPPILRSNLPAAIGAGLIWVFNQPWIIPPGEGLCIFTPLAVILQPGDVNFIWDE